MVRLVLLLPQPEVLTGNTLMLRRPLQEHRGGLRLRLRLGFRFMFRVKFRLRFRVRLRLRVPTTRSVTYR